MKLSFFTQSIEIPFDQTTARVKEDIRDQLTPRGTPINNGTVTNLMTSHNGSLSEASSQRGIIQKNIANIANRRPRTPFLFDSKKQDPSRPFPSIQPEKTSRGICTSIWLIKLDSRISLLTGRERSKIETIPVPIWEYFFSEEI